MANSKYPTNDFPVERLWDLFDFNPLTGYLISKAKNFRGKPVIGTLNNNKRMYVIQLYREGGTVLRTNYARIVYAWCKGRWPEGSIDHKNRDIRDNRLWNLREADVVLQTQNTKKFNYGTCWHNVGKKWHARIYIDGKSKFLGYFNTQKAAQEAYIRTCKEIGRPLLEPVLVNDRYVPLEHLQ